VESTKAYYEILGVDPSAEAEVIASAYEALVRKYHPDTYKGMDAENRMKEINEAYEILNNHLTRANYDKAFLFEAIKTPKKKSIEKILKSNPSLVNAQDEDGVTPLLLVSREGHKDVAELLISEGADVNAKDKWSYTPLHWASQHGQKNIAELLISKGANVDAKDDKGRTPLHFASGKGHKELVELLRRHGAKE
jgi:ankyrin repeat protein